MSDRLDRRVLRTLQVLVAGLPLFLGGRQSLVALAAALTVLGLLVVTVRERRRRDDRRDAPGIAALAAFVALALVTTLPLPPGILAMLSPATARLYADTLPGWPGGGGWSAWRSLAIDPYATWIEIGRLAIGLGVFAVLAAYPWQDTPAGESGRAWVFGRLVLTLIGTGVVLGLLGLIEAVGGNGTVLWITGVPSVTGRVSGPFVNPNHFAGWIEMVLPVGVAYAVALLRRMGRRVAQSARVGQGMGVSGRRAFVSALVVHQQRLWEPLACVTAVLLMASAHIATGSRGGSAALCAGIGVAAVGMIATRWTGRGSWIPKAIAGGLVLASVLGIVGWAALDAGSDTTSAIETVDVSLGSRFAVSTIGWNVVREFPLAGSGLGSWLHAFRPYVAPPIEGGIWDHAHNDYLELTAETGVAGALLVALFALTLIRAVGTRGGAATSGEESSAPEHGERGADFGRGFGRPGWYAALAEASHVRWGLAGGLAAILVHSVVDFSLRMPANLLLVMTILGLLVVSGPLRRARQTPALATLVLVFGLALAPQLANGILVLTGRTPLAPGDCRTAADVLLAEEGDEGRVRALALLHRALDWSPADRDAHQQLADALGPGPAGDAAARRALALEPWALEVRDQLAQRLLADGDVAEAAEQYEESMFRFPHLASHGYLSPDLDADDENPAGLIRALADGDAMIVRLATLEAPVAEAVVRGLARALENAGGGDDRAAIVADAALVLEARERWGDAATILRAEADRSVDGGANLARAARDSLKANDDAAAERSLLAAILRTPDDGDLYKALAVDVYAARADFDMAERVLEAGERNAVDLLPVYSGVTEVLKQRETRHDDGPAWAAPSPAPVEDLVP